MIDFWLRFSEDVLGNSPDVFGEKKEGFPEYIFIVRSCL